MISPNRDECPPWQQGRSLRAARTMSMISPNWGSAIGRPGSFVAPSVQWGSTGASWGSSPPTRHVWPCLGTKVRHLWHRSTASRLLHAPCIRLAALGPNMANVSCVLSAVWTWRVGQSRLPWLACCWCVVSCGPQSTHLRIRCLGSRVRLPIPPCTLCAWGSSASAYWAPSS